MSNVKEHAGAISGKEKVKFQSDGSVCAHQRLATPAGGASTLGGQLTRLGGCERFPRTAQQQESMLQTAGSVEVPTALPERL